jgi:hypothetical protein
MVMARTFILELLQGFGSDAPGTAGQDKTQERVTLFVGSNRCLLRTQGESQLSQESLDVGPSLFGLRAVLTRHDEVIGSGRIANSNATPGTYVPPGDYYRPAPLPYYMQFGPAIGMHAGYLPGYPASHGCVRMPRGLAARFFARVSIRTPVTVDGNTRELTSVRKAIPLF